tara:strand:+ start:203 stop:1513 length:1311 start_codon:yes stop_codon:yes gene_type:complete
VKKNKNKKKVYLTLVGDNLNAGHWNILNIAKKLGEVTVGLMTDRASVEYTSLPHFSYDERHAFLKKNVKFIENIVPQENLDYSKNLNELKPDIVVHGDDWKHGKQKDVRLKVIKTLKKWNGKLIEPKYTENIPISENRKQFLQNTTTSEIRKSKLSRLLKVKKIVKILEAHNPIGGIIADNVSLNINKKYDEFDGVWCSSLTDSSSRGKPDNQSLDLTTRLNWLSEMFEVTSKPCIFDADNGGQKEHFKFLIRRLEKLGVSAVIIEDKIGLKKNSLFKNQKDTKLDSVKNFCEKIKIAKKNRVSKDFLIIARLESLITGRGINDAINRAEKYSKAGADLIMPHSNKSNPNQIFEFSKKFKKSKYFKPLVSVPSTYPSVKDKDLIKNDFKIVIYANQMFRSSYFSMLNTAKDILKYGRTKEIEKRMVSIKNIIKLIE